MHRSSLTLGQDKVTPKVSTTKTLSAYSSPILSGHVEIIENFTVSSCDVEVLLDISTAFADAALALGRLQDAEKASVTS